MEESGQDSPPVDTKEEKEVVMTQEEYYKRTEVNNGMDNLSKSSGLFQKQKMLTYSNLAGGGGQNISSL